MIGRTAIKIAVVATLLTVACIIAIVVAVLLLTQEEEGYCQIKNLNLSQKDKMLLISWESEEFCDKYKVLIYKNDILDIEDITTKNEYQYGPASACTTISVVVSVSEKEILTDTYHTDISAVESIKIDGKIITWDNTNLELCNFELEINDKSVERLNAEITTYELVEDLEICAEHTVSIKARHPKEEYFGPVVSKKFAIDISPVQSLTIVDKTVTWDNTNLELCKFELQINDKPAELLNAGITTYKLEEDLEVCAKHTVRVRALHPKEDYKPGPFVPEEFSMDISAVKSIKIDGKIITWDNTNLELCNFELQINDKPVELLNAGMTTYELEEDLEICAEHKVSIKALHPNAEYFGPVVSENFAIDISPVQSLTIVDKTVTWDNTNLELCKFELQINDKLVELLNVGITTYKLDENLEACAKHTVRVRALHPKEEYDPGPFVPEEFSIEPIIDDFTVTATLKSTILKATWTNDHPKCTFSIRYENAIFPCDEMEKGECEMEIDMEICGSYKFELIATGENDEGSSVGNYLYYSVLKGEIEDFNVVYNKEEFKTIAKWTDLGPNCKYRLELGDDLVDVDVPLVDQMYTFEIPEGKIDLCTKTDIFLVALSNDVEVGKEKFVYGPLPAMKLLNLELDSKLLAEWENLGASCKYTIKFDSKEVQIEQTSVYIEDVFEVNPEYCREHTVMVSPITVDGRTGGAAENTTMKNLPPNFEGINKDVEPLILINAINVKWRLLPEFSECENIDYVVSCSLDGNEPDMDPEQINESEYLAKQCPVTAKTETFHFYIQPEQTNEFGHVIGAKMKCDIQIGLNNNIENTNCEYILSEKSS